MCTDLPVVAFQQHQFHIDAHTLTKIRLMTLAPAQFRRCQARREGNILSYRVALFAIFGSTGSR